MRLLIDSDRVESEATCPGSERSLRFGLIQREVDPRSHDEIEVDAHSANGTLDVTISQLSTGVSLRLPGVNQCEGRQIRTPSSPLPGPPPGAAPPPDRDTGSGAGQDPGSGGSPADFPSEPARGWSQDAHDFVIRVANHVLHVVREVCHQLLVAGLLTHEEAGKLARGMEGVR